MFADYAKIHIASGKGGDGCVSFYRDKNVPLGGPDGGDGGHGGAVIFVQDLGLNTLTPFRYKRNYVASDGENGQGRHRHGKDGEDVIIKVPSGTVIKDAESGRVIADISGDVSTLTVLKGGRGGSGNQHYATSVMQAPKYAKPGQDGKALDVILELKVIADVGLAGFPNVGKSTLLARVSNARPKIANYHFTTLEPHLGVVDIDGERGFVMADIPGLIEGASEGLGLGHEFLRHIERTRVIVHIVDAAGSEGRDPVDDIRKINAELAAYSDSLAALPQIIAANKLDLLEDGGTEIVSLLKKAYEPRYEVIPISAATGMGIRELLYRVRDILDSSASKPVIFEQEYDPETADAPVDPYTARYDEAADEYVLEGPRIEKMLGYTNLDDDKGFAFFQDFVKQGGMIDDLIALGLQEGDTVRLYGHVFTYYE